MSMDFFDCLVGKGADRDIVSNIIRLTLGWVVDRSFYPGSSVGNTITVSYVEETFDKEQDLSTLPCYN